MNSCLKKQEELTLRFLSCTTQEARYQLLIELGQDLSPLAQEYKTPLYLVKGCQSQMYLRSFSLGGKLFFEAASESLISAGLAALLIAIYSGETPETILQCPPTCLDTMGIHASLTPGRSNGLSSLLLRMKQDAVNSLMI